MAGIDTVILSNRHTRDSLKSYFISIKNYTGEWYCESVPFKLNKMMTHFYKGYTIKQLPNLQFEINGLVYVGFICLEDVKNHIDEQLNKLNDLINKGQNKIKQLLC